jgi:hypothetical protein
MSFIKRVQERMNNTEDYAQFKDLPTAYGLARRAQVVFPKVYTLLNANAEPDWPDISRQLPSLFVVRPSVFLNTRFDYFLRDDDSYGIYNYTLGEKQSHLDMLQEQLGNIVLSNQEDATTLMFEEFPLASHLLEYPAHYRMHMFYDAVGMVQITTQEGIWWLDPKLHTISSKGTFNTGLPDSMVYDDLCEAARQLSIQTQLPYVRVDFVLSTRGPMFRSFACMPGDVRSAQHNEVYKLHNDNLNGLWLKAEQALSKNDTQEPEDNVNDTKPDLPPDDNA